MATNQLLSLQLCWIHQKTDIDGNLLDDVDSSDINVAGVVSNDDSATVTNELSSSASTTPPPTVKGLSDVIPKLDNRNRKRKHEDKTEKIVSALVGKILDA